MNTRVALDMDAWKAARVRSERVWAKIGVLPFGGGDSSAVRQAIMRLEEEVAVERSRLYWTAL